MITASKPMRKTPGQKRTTMFTVSEFQKQLHQDAEATDFQKSILLMRILKKNEKEIFREREAETTHLMGLINKQNQLFGTIQTLLEQKPCTSQQDLDCNRDETIPVVSSMNALEDLDINRREKINSLQRENDRIVTHINSLQQTLDRINSVAGDSTLNPVYLNELAERVEKRTKQNECFGLKVNKIQGEQKMALRAIKQQLQDILTADEFSSIFK